MSVSPFPPALGQPNGSLVSLSALQLVSDAVVSLPHIPFTALTAVFLISCVEICLLLLWWRGEILSLLLDTQKSQSWELWRHSALCLLLIRAHKMRNTLLATCQIIPQPGAELRVGSGLSKLRLGFSNSLQCCAHRAGAQGITSPGIRQGPSAWRSCKHH